MLVEVHVTFLSIHGTLAMVSQEPLVQFQTHMPSGKRVKLCPSQATVKLLMSLSAFVSTSNWNAWVTRLSEASDLWEVLLLSDAVMASYWLSLNSVPHASKAAAESRALPLASCLATRVVAGPVSVLRS